MKLLKLTPSNPKIKHPIYVSADRIESVEVQTDDTLVIANGSYHYVMESPESIEALANSVPGNLDFRALIKFARWHQSNNSKFLGKTLHQMVNAFIAENWPEGKPEAW